MVALTAQEENGRERLGGWEGSRAEEEALIARPQKITGKWCLGLTCRSGTQSTFSSRKE